MKKILFLVLIAFTHVVAADIRVYNLECDFGILDKKEFQVEVGFSPNYKSNLQDIKVYEHSFEDIEQNKRIHSHIINLYRLNGSSKSRLPIDTSRGGSSFRLGGYDGVYHSPRSLINLGGEELLFVFEMNGFKFTEATIQKSKKTFDRYKGYITKKERIAECKEFFMPN